MVNPVQTIESTAAVAHVRQTDDANALVVAARRAGIAEGGEILLSHVAPEEQRSVCAGWPQNNLIQEFEWGVLFELMCNEFFPGNSEYRMCQDPGGSRC
jgi:hypothetical protein